MKYADVVKAMLLASIHELAANPQNYALHPGKDFSRNRKLGFKHLLLMLLTMEADCIKEELYRFFGRMLLQKLPFINNAKRLKMMPLEAFSFLLLKSVKRSCLKANIP